MLGESNPLTALVVNLTGVDPDDAFSVVPYEKGSTFLWYLEDLVGGPRKIKFPIWMKDSLLTFFFLVNSQNGAVFEELLRAVQVSID